MRQFYYLLAFIFLFLLSSKTILSKSIQNDSLKVYLIFSFQNPKIFKDSSSMNLVESEIERIFENEGIHLIHEEKPEEFKIDINIQIGDSLRIEENSISVSGNSVVVVNQPRISYPYKNETEIYNCIKDYIKNKLGKKH